jgi:hypothetical protein
MTKAALLGAMLMVIMAAPAAAQDCAASVQAVDQALASPPDVGEEQIAQAQELRDQGAALCENGQAAEAEAVLMQAKAILGLS